MAADENTSNRDYSRLNGNTMRTYMFLLKNKKVGTRELQRKLGMSNPYLAHYHLSILAKLGLLSESDGTYYLIESEMKSFLGYRLAETSLILERILTGSKTRIAAKKQVRDAKGKFDEALENFLPGILALEKSHFAEYGKPYVPKAVRIVQKTNDTVGAVILSVMNFEEKYYEHDLRKHLLEKEIDLPEEKIFNYLEQLRRSHKVARRGKKFPYVWRRSREQSSPTQ